MTVFQKSFFAFLSSAQIIFGDTDLVVEYKDVTVWETSLLNSDFAKVLADDNFVPNGIMTQGWWNIKLTKAVQLSTQELSGEQFMGNVCFF